MKATDILKDEHRVIERVLDCLETAARRLESGVDVSPGFFIDAADFIKGFADGCHHNKEEGVLFKAMVAHGLNQDGGPIAVMLDEHEEARGLTRNMRSGAERMESGDSAASAKVVSSALDYVALLRQHIQKEDNVLFPMADQVIPADDGDRLLTDFEHIEHEDTGKGVHEKYLALAKDLEERMK